LNREWQVHEKSNELTDAFLARCLVAGQLYPSCGFSSADCRCFQVLNPCLAIHSTAFMHRTASTDRDF